MNACLIGGSFACIAIWARGGEPPTRPERQRFTAEDPTTAALSNLTASINTSLAANTGNSALAAALEHLTASFSSPATTTAHESALAAALEHLTASLGSTSSTNANTSATILAQVPKWDDLNKALAQSHAEFKTELQTLRGELETQRESGAKGFSQFTDQLNSLKEKRGVSKEELDKSTTWSASQVGLFLAGLAAGLAALARSFGPSRGQKQIEQLGDKQADIATAVAKLETAHTSLAALQAQFAAAQPQLAASLHQSLAAIQAQLAAANPQLAASVQQSIAALQAQLAVAQQQFTANTPKSTGTGGATT